MFLGRSKADANELETMRSKGVRRCQDASSHDPHARFVMLRKHVRSPHYAALTLGPWLALGLGAHRAAAFG